jgi:hypothetical protein
MKLSFYEISACMQFRYLKIVMHNLNDLLFPSVSRFQVIHLHSISSVISNYSY